MKVAIFTDTFAPQVNGVARTVGRISSFLGTKNIPYLIFAPDGGQDRPLGKNIHTFPSLDFPFYPECKIAIPNFSQVKDILSDFQPDIIHVVTEFSLGLCGLKYAKDHGLPIVASYTTNFPQYLNYYKTGFLERWAWQYLHWFHNQCRLNLCPSPASQAMLAKKGFKNLTIWGRGIDTEVFSPAQRKDSIRKKLASDKRLLFLFVGRLAVEKDLDVLLKAWDTAKASIPDAQLIITGDGPMMEELRQTADPAVIFTGYRHGEELAEIYAASDVFVFPSTTETFGNVVLEAMASGLPVIAAEAGGVKNLIRDGDNGLACRPRNYLDLAAAILKMAQNKPLRKKIGRQARQYALEQKWDGILNQLVENYEKTVFNSKRIRSESI